MSIPSVLLALLAAGANAFSSVMQRKAARESSDTKSLRPGLILDLLHRPVWFAGLAGVVAGFLLQSAALAAGGLVTVQPVLVVELPLTLLLASWLLHSRMGREVWVAATMMAAGLSILLFAAAPQGGRPPASPTLWLMGVAGNVCLIALAVWLGRRSRSALRAAYLGVAAGATFGLTAALMKAATSAFQSGPVEGFTAWQTYAMVVAGAGAMFILQSALQAGRLAAAQPGITLADPVIASAWGLLLFGEHARSGLYLIGEVGGATMMMAAVVLLARSPSLEGHAGRREEATPGPEAVDP